MSGAGIVPTVGRIVLYTLSSYDADAINKRRANAVQHLPEYRANKDGSQIHVGNGVAAGDVFPMVIVRVWGSTLTSAVNGQVLLDGNDTYWATSVTEGDGDHNFAWPARS